MALLLLPRIKEEKKMSYLQKLLTALFVLSVSFATAQTGKISGKIINDKNEPITGVSVTFGTNKKGVLTNSEGVYVITIAPGNYKLTFSSLGYGSKIVEDVIVKKGQTFTLDIVLVSADNKLEGVVVTSTSSAKKETVNTAIAFQKNSNTVAQVISAEMIRRSPDRTTGDVIKRTPGASLQDGKFLIVRGLADRYNLAMLNGVPLSSTEPDRKTFSFDMIPAAMIDNIVINKAFVPEFPAEWAGGLIQINTRDIPSQNFFNIQLGTGFNTQSISNDFYSYQGGKTDWLGLDDGFRKLPAPYTTKGMFNSSLTTDAERNEVAKNMKNVWTGNKLSFPVNQQFQASGGFNKTIFKNKKLGGVFALTYNRKFNYNKNETNDNVVSENSPTYIYNSAFNDNRYSQDVLWGALGNVALQLDNNNKISVKTLFNVSSSKYITNRTGVENFGNPVYDSVRATELAFKENIFFNGQVSGDHNIFNKKVKFHWYGSFNVLSGYQPDQRRLLYNKRNDIGNSPYLLLIGNSLSQKTGSRLYQTLSEYVYTGGGDATYSFNWLGFKQSIKGGYLFQVKDRLFDAQFFSTELDPAGNQAIKLLPADKVFAPENFGNGNLQFNMIKGDIFRYMANTILNAGFIQFDNQFTKKLRAVYGVRVENYDQVIGSLNSKDSRHSHSEVRDFLPGANLTYKLTNTTNIRLSGSQTVVRPEFRELTDFTFYDFDLNGTVQGSKGLVRTKVTNADLRYEWYPRAGELITFGVFYKHFKNPIVQRFFADGGGAYVFDNADKGYTFGPELEVRKRLDFISDKLRNFTFQTNLSYIKSNSKKTEPNGDVSFDEPFQGQSDYLINAGLLYDLTEQGFNATLLFNQIGKRLAYYGDINSSAPGIWENPRPVLDFQISQKIIKKRGELKLNISDILNQRLYFYQNTNDSKNFQKGIDAVRFSRKYGTTFSLTFAYSFL